MSISKRIIFDKEILDMVKSLSKIELKDEISKVDEMLEQTQEELAQQLAYKDLLYREAWNRGQREERENQD